ncbi:LLM class F420-dependent oxidoreductase [Williamsia sp. 1135]|uniref:LLM class F420-dependent oxidoreductase n=1 Tax=Williamsia sp. 1135 TaxID=1889262 RepID=UPI000A11E1D0|nr:LLM class F420-dependent oxidoreductase [Williamsia sp. 1135]ORM35336.1 LLM class F420-dependent oxidoreductase [Williamsia sp. 1135]
MSIRLGYQIPNFSYPGGNVADLFPTVIAQAQEAESAGFDTVLVMDHFYQLPGIGSPDEPMLEAYTALGALATATSTINLSTLVTGNTYRNPAMLAKTITTLDVVSGGRAILGLGAGWFELEHDEMGYEFGTFTERFERLEEALQIIEPMLRGKKPELDGKWYQAHGTRNNPQFRTDLPIMLGGGGEKKTFGMAARYAQHLNVIAAPSELPRKLDALAKRCEEAGRDRSTIKTSFLATVFLDADGDKARAEVVRRMRANGVDHDSVSADDWAKATERFFVGSPDEVAADIKARVLDVGIDGLTINMLHNGHEPGNITLAGKALAPLVN